jgi:hypothetical protein
MLKNLLVLRLTVFNVLGFCALLLAAQQGWLWMVYEADASRISFAIWALWLTALVQQTIRAQKVAQDLNDFKKRTVSSIVDYDVLKVQRDKAMMKVAWMYDAAVWLMRLGLMGTVVGFIMALSGVGLESVSSAESAKESVGTLVPGMRVALFTTLLGMTLGTWIEVNRRMIVTALHNYHCDRIARLGK